MLDIEHHTIVLSVTYAGQPGEDLDDVCGRLVGAVARSPGVTGAVAMNDLPLTEMHNHITDQLYAMFPAEHGGITALRPLLRSQVNEAYKRGATASLAILCDIHDPAGWPSLEARMATTLHVSAGAASGVLDREPCEEVEQAGQFGHKASELR